MSSGVELILLAPFLVPGILVWGGAAAGGAVTGAVTGVGAVTVSGGSITTTSFFATGGTAAAAGGAGGAGGAAVGGSSALAVGAAAAGSVAMVTGIAAVALMAAENLHQNYQRNLALQRARLNPTGPDGPNAPAAQIHALVDRSRLQSTALAEAEFVRHGIFSLQKRLLNQRDIDPRLPGGCAHLLEALEKPEPDLQTIFQRLQQLSTLASRYLSAQNSLQSSASTTGAGDARAEFIELLRADIGGLRAELKAAPGHVLAPALRDQLLAALEKLELAVAEQPVVAEQGLQILRSRIGREITTGMENAARRKREQEIRSGEIRELVGSISARCQATLQSLDHEEIAKCAAARKLVQEHSARAVALLETLASALNAPDLQDLTPIRNLVEESDALFHETAQALRDLANQVYLEEKLTEVFGQLGYRVTSIAPNEGGPARLTTTLGSDHGLEVCLGGNGALSSELVTYGTAQNDFDAALQDKVCDLMDQVLEGMRKRGCKVRERARRQRHVGSKPLRQVARPQRTQEGAAPQAAVPQARSLKI